ncbi:hypothetical protein MW7_016555 [Imbroritus primus]|uniref:Uncharacterized protein n=1 Tax=Imbroritus primus TaxID=3058603 RepID=A0ACD3SKE7_9BURK|nr:hypothetical protein MW7_016555 [Burkholderiaceae bacterium PBA]
MRKNPAAAMQAPPGSLFFSRNIRIIPDIQYSEYGDAQITCRIIILFIYDSLNSLEPHPLFCDRTFSPIRRYRAAMPIPAACACTRARHAPRRPCACRTTSVHAGLRDIRPACQPTPGAIGANCFPADASTAKDNHQNVFEIPFKDY